MPGPISKPASTYVSSDTALTAATEAVVATIPGVNTEGASQTVRLIGHLKLTTAAGATGTTLRWRRGSLTGTQVGEANSITTAASTTFSLDHCVDDQPGEVASQVYVLTATVAGGNGTCIEAEAFALISS